MNVQERTEIRELTAEEVELVSGGLKVVEEAVAVAQGVAIFVWDLCTNWHDPWA
jgi:hypothetical protein